MTTPNFKTFDLAAVISGIDFPEHTVDVYLDESLGFSIYQAEEALRNAELRRNSELVDKLVAELDAVKASTNDHRFKVTVRGIPESARRACDTQARKEFPADYNFMGQLVPSPERDDLFNRLLWSESIIRFEDPTGAVAVITPELVTQLREEAGRTVIQSITVAIDELVKGTKSGFESAAQSVDFLSDASPEG